MLNSSGTDGERQSAANAESVAVKISEIAPGTGKLVTVNGKAIAVFSIGGVFHAIDNACPHRQGPLFRGRVEGASVRCPMHGWLFDLRTGACVNQPQQKVGCFPVRVEGDQCVIEGAD